MSTRTVRRSAGLLMRSSALLVLSPLAPVSSADWRYVEPQAAVAVNPEHFLVSPERNLWTFDAFTLQRTDAAGNARTLPRTALNTPAGEEAFTDGVALSEGGVILHNADCQILRIDDALRPIWRVDLPDCNRVDAHAGGMTWAAGDLALYQLTRDGILRSTLVFGIGERITDFRTLHDGGVLVLSQMAQPRVPTVRRIDAKGRTLWSGSAGPGAAQRVAPAEDGGAYSAGIDASGTIQVSRLGSNGTPLWTTQHPARGDDVVLSIEHADRAAVYIVTGLSATDVPQPKNVLRVDANGELSWRQPFCPAAVPGTSETPAISATLTVDPAGSVANLCAQPGPDRLLRRNGIGQIAADLALPFDRAVQLKRIDDLLYVLGRELPAPLNRTQLITVDGTNRMLPTVLGEPGSRAVAQLRAQTADADGATYLLTQVDESRADPREQYLSKIAADGTLAWKISAPTFALRAAELSVAGNRVCSAERAVYQAFDDGRETLRAGCFEAMTGSGLFLESTLPGFWTRNRVRALNNGGAMQVKWGASDYVITRYNADGGGSVVATADGVASAAGIGENGHVVLAFTTRLTQYDSAGRQSYFVPGPLSEYHADFDVGADGSVVVFGRSPNQAADQRSVASLAANGSTRWVADLGGGFDKGRIVHTADAVYVLQYDPTPGSDTTTTTRVTRLSAATGVRIWQHDSVNPTIASDANTGGAFALSPSGDALVLAHSWRNRLRLERLDAATGEQTFEHVSACDEVCAQPSGLWLSADGAARVALTVVDRSAGQTAAVLSFDHIARDAPRTRVDQPGLAGLWYSPYANGEGISFDWLPASRTLFGAWFTYTGAGGNDPAGLRWYTLQVNGVPANATELELPILETTGGNFDDGPAVSPRPVGHATLSFSDCSIGTLRYQFDAGHNDAARGSITLTRLTPATQNCIAADGSSQPGSGARPPAKGFDARMSGAWYDDTSIGQGLQLNIQPDGVFFAPWFTYDPAGSQNDPGRQHWFTLQGDLSEAVNGRVEVKLIQTTGGAFDRVPTYNAYVVGFATLTVQSCDRATLDYRFGSEPLAGAYAGRTGTLDLRRMGDCAP